MQPCPYFGAHNHRSDLFWCQGNGSCLLHHIDLLTPTWQSQQECADAVKFAFEMCTICSQLLTPWLNSKLLLPIIVRNHLFVPMKSINVFQNRKFSKFWWLLCTVAAWCWQMSCLACHSMAIGLWPNIMCRHCIGRCTIFYLDRVW